MDFRNFEKGLKRLIAGCLKEFNGDFDAALEIPRAKGHGDLSSNVALQLAGRIGKRPMEYAALLAARINDALKASPLKRDIDRAEAKEPGFINFWFSENRLFETLDYIVRHEKAYGSLNMGKRKRVNIEFVSANPTGPLTIAHGRQAAFGDTLANILTRADYRVTREYYLNDEGNQIELLARSVRAAYLGLMDIPCEAPKDGYKGSYITDIAREIKDRYGARFAKRESLRFFADFGCKRIIEGIKKDLKDFNVDFDIWYSQKKLSTSGRIKNGLRFLRRKNLLYEKGGATWFRSSQYGDEKDRVVIKSTGEYTYLAPDIAYHMHKFKRGFENIIDIWGPDHHGYIPRIKAAVKTFASKKASLKVLIVQLSTLYKEGKPVRMSTRAGEFITLRDLIQEVGRDVARFFFLTRKRDSHLDFDLELAKRHSMDNPVYYIQYAHARICSLLKYRKQKKGKAASGAAPKRSCLKSEDDIAVIKLLGRFPFVIGLCARNLEVFPLISYLEETAAAFHSYYDRHRIVTDDARLTEARLFLCLAIRIVLAGGLKLLGAASPESM